MRSPGRDRHRQESNRKTPHLLETKYRSPR